MLEIAPQSRDKEYNAREGEDSIEDVGTLEDEEEDGRIEEDDKETESKLTL